MEGTDKDRDRIPEKYKNHCMIGKYEYERVDKDTGKDCHTIFTSVIVSKLTATVLLRIYTVSDN